MKRLWTLAAASIVIAPSMALAQAGPAPAPAPSPAPAPAPQAPQPYVPPQPQAAPPSMPRGPIGGGNATESSARPHTGDEEDSFDLGGHVGAGTVRGGEGGPVFFARSEALEVPGSHVVRHGDTLWGICDHYFRNPYQWPRVWSYNPQIRNPHWIYPGDEVKLREGAGLAVAANPSLPGGGLSLVDRRRQVPNETIFLRDVGWVQDATDEVWGQVSGAVQDKMFLTDTDEAYLEIDPKHDVHVGQELTIFRPRASATVGSIVQILGTVRIDAWNPHDRVARAQVVETLDVIERGAKIGPLARKVEVVPPRRNDVDVQAHILASVHPNVFYAQYQIAFIDQGEASGLRPGNRLFILRRGDAWRRSLATPGAGHRVSPDNEKPMPPMEKTPGSRLTEENYPDEYVGELRVVSTKKDTSVCVVTSAKLEIEAYDLAVARKGY